MFDVPATIACADAGDLERAERHPASASRLRRIWQGASWEAAIDEAHAHVARARDDPETAARLLSDAASLFAQVGQPLNAERWRATAARRPKAVAT